MPSPTDTLRACITLPDMAPRPLGARGWVLLAALLAVAALRLHLPTFHASNLAVVPDALEYATSAQRLAELGTFDIEVEGRRYAPNVSPGFPVLFLAPLYAVAGSELGNAIYVELALALTALSVGFLLAHRLAGPWAALAAGVALLLHPTFERWSREIMTDVPSLALGLMALGCALTSRRDASALRLALVGVLAALAFALRFVYLAALAPALLLALSHPRPLRAAVILVAPSAVVALATFAFNAHAFGDPLRTGYHFWVPVPYDYPELTFSWGYLAENLAVFTTWHMALPLAALALGCALLWRARELRPIVVACLAASLPISLFHLRYYYIDERFHLLLVAIGCILGASALARCLPESSTRFSWAGLGVLLPLAIWPAPPQDMLPGRRSTANALARLTPEDAVVISAIDPVFLEPYLLRGTKRRVIPASRVVPYANGIAAPQRIANPQSAPKDALDRRCAGLLAGGGIDPVSITAVENPAEIVALVRSGASVYLDLTMDRVTGAAAALQRAGLVAEPVADKKWLVRLR